MPETKIVVNSGGFDFTFDEAEINQIKVINTDNKHFTVLKGTNSLVGKLKPKVASLKRYNVEFEGESFNVTLKTALEQRLESMGLNVPKVTKLKTVKAPMPGLVIDIDLSEGQVLTAGEKILILEAMKMENVLKIPHDAVIKKVLVSKGQAVDKGQTLIELE